MNQTHLKYLIAISKESSMAEAARKLYVTPQALSMAIKKLEEELQMPLLSRSSTGTELTNNGKWLCMRTEQFFHDVAERQKDYAEYIHLADPVLTGDIEILMNPVGVGPNHADRFVGRLLATYPQASIRVTELSDEEIRQRLAEDTAELALVYRWRINGRYPDTLPEDRVFTPLQNGRPVIQCSPTFGIQPAKPVSLEKLADMPLICHAGGVESRLRELFRTAVGRDANIVETNSHTLYRAALESGRYYTLSVKMEGDDPCSDYLSGMQVTECREDMEIQFGILRKNNRKHSSNTAILIHEFSRIAVESESTEATKQSEHDPITEATSVAEHAAREEAVDATSDVLTDAQKTE